MSDGMPEQDKVYTESDVNHIVARRIAAEQHRELKDKVISNENDSIKMFADIRASLGAINEAIVAKSQEMMVCKTDIRKEIDGEFVSEKIFNLEMARIENLMDTKMEGIEKSIKGQWKANAVTNTVLFMVLGFIFKIAGGV